MKFLTQHILASKEGLPSLRVSPYEEFLISHMGIGASQAHKRPKV